MKIYQIRYAKPEEAEILTDLIWRSKASWGYPREWLESWRELLTITPEMIESMISLIAEDQGKIMGFWAREPLSYSEKPSRGFLFIEPAVMGTGCGRQLFQAMKSELIQRNVYSFSLEADPHAEDFYLKMGGKKIAEIESSIPGRMLPIIRFDFG